MRPLGGAGNGSAAQQSLRANLEGTYNLYEAAREEGVKRIIFASSNHTVGYTPSPEGDIPLDPCPPIWPY